MTGMPINMMDHVSALLTVLFSAVVVYACFCRLTKTDRKVLTSVRWSIALLATVAAFMGFAVVFRGWQPDLVHAALMGAVAGYQIATRRTWRHGVPEWFTRDHAWPR